ncbi:MAG: serine hydrolase domain-containing protein [Candidatus Rifleibacteriota bacterium]
MSLSNIELKNLLEHHQVAGVSFAVLRNFCFEYAQCVGMANNHEQAPLWPDTIFQGASLSKTIATALTLKLSEKGIIDLDEPINPKLKSWKLPENEWTREKPVTTRHLLSHFSGINVPTYRGYFNGETVPALKDILEGNKLSYEPAIEVTDPVDEQFIYSTGAFAVLEILLEDITGENFDTLINHEILQPLDMSRTFFYQPLPTELQNNCASGHRYDTEVVAGNWFVYPTLAGSGIWTTPTDLAKFAADLQRTIKTDTAGILKPETIKEMLSPYSEPFFGLGFALYQDKGPGMYFGHTGNTEGFRAMFVAHATNGCGAFILANSDNADPVIKEIINQIAATENWEGFIW